MRADAARRRVRKTRSEPQLSAVSSEAGAPAAEDDDGTRLVAVALQELAKEVSTLGKQTASSAKRVAGGPSMARGPAERQNRGGAVSLPALR